MRTILPIIVGSLHVLAAAAFIGGGLLMNYGVMRATSKIDPEAAGKVNMGVGMTYSVIAWVSIGILALTGLMRSAASGAFAPRVLFNTPYGKILILKILLLLAIVVIGVMIGGVAKKIQAAMESGDPQGELAALSQRIGTLSKLNVYIAVFIVVLAVSLRMIGFKH